MINSERVINKGDTFVNEGNGGQEVTVTTTSFNGMAGVIGYELHDSFRFSSLKHSNCEDGAFRETFSDITIEKLTVNQAVRKACKEVHENDPGKKVEKALNLLGYGGERVYNYSLSQFDTKSVTRSVLLFMETYGCIIN